jgi:hypothetical protein
MLKFSGQLAIVGATHSPSGASLAEQADSNLFDDLAVEDSPNELFDTALEQMFAEE